MTNGPFLFSGPPGKRYLESEIEEVQTLPPDLMDQLAAAQDRLEKERENELHAAWEAGREAGRQDQSKTTNPYKHHGGQSD